MQNKILPVLIAATLFTCGARAQSDSQQAPAPAPSAAPAPQPVQSAQPAQPQAAMAAPAPNQVIYSPRLPTPAELSSVAAAQGLTVEQISQTANQVTAIYRNANGQLTTVAYQLLPTGAQPAATTTVVVPNPAPTVVYQTSPSVIYYRDPYYYPRYYYPPVSLSFGFGYGWGHGGWGHGGYGHHWR